MKTNLALIQFCLILVSTLSFGVFADQAKSEIHGNWKLTCENRCVISQGLKASDSNVLYGITVSRLQEGDAMVAQINLPLGVYLPQGIGLKVGKVRHESPVTTCLPKGCVAIIKLDRETLDALKKESDLGLRFYLTEKRPKEITFSLRGFDDAYKALIKESV